MNLPREKPMEGVITIDGPAGGVYQYWVKNPYLTVAGQTAPSPGITLKGIKLVLRTHDVLIQHIRVRLGDMIDPSISQDDLDTWSTNAKDFLENRDCISIGNHPEKDADNIVIDHCSFSWSMDENIEIYKNSGGELHDITVSNSITSEGLYRSVRAIYDPVWDHASKGLLVASYRSPINISIIGNLLSHNQDRNPVVADGSSVVANNLVYNPENWGPNTYANFAPVKTSFVGNVVISGPNSGQYVKAPFSVASHAWKPWYNNGIGSEVYAFDNVSESYGSDPWDSVYDKGGLEKTIRVNHPPIWPIGFSARSGSEVQNFVLNNAGARPVDRDSVDQRICNDVSALTGKFINSQSDVGGWPNLGKNSRPLNLPDNPHDDDDTDGYTNLEEWLHKFAAQVEGSNKASISPPDGFGIE